VREDTTARPKAMENKYHDKLITRKREGKPLGR
jgi:hypothetical protein